MSVTTAALAAEAQAIADNVQQSFGGLSGEHLNRKPGADAWSVAQCLEHLILINRGYDTVFGEIQRGEYRPSLKHRLPLLPGMFGALILKLVQPTAKQKAKALPKFTPGASAIDGDIVQRFLAHQQDVIAAMKWLDGQGNVVITSPVAGFVTYSVRDAFRIMLAHERRHIEQARRALVAT